MNGIFLINAVNATLLWACVKSWWVSPLVLSSQTDQP